MTIGNTSLKLSAVALAATLVLAACSDDSQDGGGAEARQSTPSDSQAPAAQTASDGTQTPSEAMAAPSQTETEPSGQPTPDFAKKVATASDVEFDGIASWINSEPLTLESLRGNVVLVDFWTYSCINCVWTLPHLKEWYDKYTDQGLVIVGVHSPEMRAEKKREKVLEAVAEHDLKYPIAQDNDFETWRAFGTVAWPTLYLVDKDGIIRYSHFGSGGYDETEMKIQELLAEPGT
jgi:thiol-disulfide isomerase/thioredoxin